MIWIELIEPDVIRSSESPIRGNSEYAVVGSCCHKGGDVSSLARLCEASYIRGPLALLDCLASNQLGASGLAAEWKIVLSSCQWHDGPD